MEKTRAKIVASMLLYTCSFFLSADLCESEEYYSIVAEIDPRLAAQIITTLMQYDLAECMTIMHSIGKAQDPNVYNLVSILLSDFHGSDAPKVELMLRMLIDSVFFDSLAKEVRVARAATNREAIMLLVSSIPRLTDRLLKGEIVRVLEHAFAPEYASQVMAEGHRITRMLRQGTGRCDDACTFELNAIIDLVRAHRLSDALGFCSEIMSLTRDRSVFENARTTIAVLFAR